ncbi:hypothetical protein E4U55_006082 [Claviceps digitariae]|nr:hypothetical protein E4U55_006082 [Claviceps digitariae]
MARFEFWQVAGSPGLDSGLVSKFVDVPYYRMMCDRMFPRRGKYMIGLDAGRSATTVNMRTGGWNVTKPMKRIMFTSGELDPWRPATLSADRRPGGPLKSTPETPLWIIPNGTHCSDLWVENSKVNAEMGRIFEETLVKMHSWVTHNTDIIAPAVASDSRSVLAPYAKV